MLAPAAEAGEITPELAAFARESCRRYAELVAAVEAVAGESCGYRPDGTFLVALHRDHWAELEHLAEMQRAAGLRAERLSAEALREREPYLSPRQQGGLWLADDHQVDPRRLHAALRTAVARLGGVLLDQARVTALGWTGERVSGVTLAHGHETLAIEATAVVLAAGVWSTDALPDVPRLPLRPVRGQIVRVSGPALISRVVRTPGVYLVPRLAGEMLVGAVSEEAGFDLEPRAGAVLELLREAWEVVPGVAEHAFVETVVGFRPALRDNLPAIGALGDGLYVATGHYRHGIMLAPITAQLLIDGITTGVMPPALAPFSPGRFAGLGRS
jgi:glycine oxidase